jgi:FlaA1/EpsC-like NDP-sugar epimerase
MKANIQLKELLNRPLTDDELVNKEIEEFDRQTERVYENLLKSRDYHTTYLFNPFYRIALDSDLYKNKELLKRFTDVVESYGFHHEFNAPQNAYCIYIKQR